MFNSKFNGMLTILLIITIIGIIILISFFGWSVYNKYYLNTEAKKAVETFEQIAVENNKTEKPKDDEDGERTQIGGVEDGNSMYEAENNKPKEATKYYGYEVLGTISIPKINIEYPILEKVTPQSIKVAVAYLSGVRNKQSWKYSNSRT